MKNFSIKITNENRQIVKDWWMTNRYGERAFSTHALYGIIDGTRESSGFGDRKYPELQKFEITTEQFIYQIVNGNTDTIVQNYEIF